MSNCNWDLSKYYREQAGQKKYLDALLNLASPSPLDVVLDVGTGSGTISFYLGERVKKIYGIDPDANLIKKRQAEIIQMVETHKVSPTFNVDFEILGAEDIGVRFPVSYFDTIVCWGSVHHFGDYIKAMKGISQTCKPGGTLIIFDAFFPESVRDFWEMASTIHDPTTVRHHTYFEYMEMLRLNGFIPETILPFRHPVNLNKWLDKINKPDEGVRTDDVLSDMIKSLHPGKYDQWLSNARQKGLKETLKQEILNLDDEKKGYLSLINPGNDEYEFTYDAFVLSAVKDRRSK